MLNVPIPVKSLSNSKTRLAPILDADAQRNLVEYLLVECLKQLGTQFPQLNVLIVTPDLEVAAIAKKFKASVLFEKETHGLNKAIDAGTQWTIANGHQPQLVIFPDILNLCPIELTQLLESVNVDKHVSFSVAKDKGTNALLTTPPDIMPFQYGENSSEVMIDHVRKNKIPYNVFQFKNMAFDIDTPEDYMRFRPYLSFEKTVIDRFISARTPLPIIEKKLYTVEAN